MTANSISASAQQPELPNVERERWLSLSKPRPRVKLWLPWNSCFPNNRRLSIFTPKGHNKRAMLIHAPDYRQAKTFAEFNLKGQWAHRARIQGPVHIVGHGYFPDLRQRDAGNYSKLFLDALTGIAYDDDSQVHDERWLFAGIDRLNPRFELYIGPLTYA